MISAGDPQKHEVGFLDSGTEDPGGSSNEMNKESKNQTLTCTNRPLETDVAVVSPQMTQATGLQPPTQPYIHPLSVTPKIPPQSVKKKP